MTKPKTIHKLFALRRALMDQGLTKADVLTLAALIEYRNSKSGESWPSVPSLACVTKLSQRCIQLALRRLENGGHIATRLGGGRTSNTYEVLLNDDKSPLSDRIKEARQIADERRTMVHPSKPEEVNDCSTGVNDCSSRGEQPFARTLLKNPTDKNPSANSAEHSDECRHLNATVSQRESSKRSKRKPQPPIPPDFPTSEAKLNVQDIFTNAGARLDADEEAAKFRDYHLSKDSRYNDWSAAFRTWARNAVYYANRDTSPAKRENPYQWAM